MFAASDCGGLLHANRTLLEVRFARDGIECSESDEVRVGLGEVKGHEDLAGRDDGSDAQFKVRHLAAAGKRLYELARGIDENPVVPNRPTQSISAEDTFEQDVPLAETEPMIRRLAEKTWAASCKESRIARTVVLKLKTAQFQVLTRSQTPLLPPASCEALTQIALSLRDKVSLDPRQRFRLVGVGLGNFRDPGEDAEPSLFP